MRHWGQVGLGLMALILVATGVSAPADEVRVRPPWQVPILEDRFLIQGRPLEAQEPPLPDLEVARYRSAIARMNGEASCFVPGEAGVPIRLNWSDIRGQRDLEVCAFFLAQALGDMEALRRSLMLSGFTVGAPLPVPPGAAMWGSGDRLMLSAGLAADRIPRGFGRPFETVFVHALVLSITLTPTGDPLSARASYTIT